MKNTVVKMKLAVVAALSCACAVAWAENVLYIHPEDYVSGKGAEAFGTKDYAFADKISTAVSIAIWAKDVSATYGKFLAGVNGRWNLAIPHTSSYATGNKRLTFRTEFGNAMADGYVLNDGKWHFIVGTFNYDSGNAANTFQRLYVDGELIAELTDGISAITTPDKMFTLGGSAVDMSSTGSIGETDGLSGHFAELSVWNRALSSAEVNGLYTKTSRLVGNESGLVAYWPLAGTPGMAAADYKFPNLAATSGVPNFTARVGSTRRVAIEDDDGFTKPYARFVASPEWCAANTYVQPETATGRSWSDPLTNLVETAAGAKKFERILCSPGTHKIESSISPLVEYFYLGSQDPATGEPCPETAIIDAQQQCRHFISSNQTSEHQSGFTVENLTFINGRESNGGSMYFRSRVGNINNCIFHDNAATGNGGAYYSYTVKDMVVSNCQFYGNSAANTGGAVYLMQNAESTTDFQRFVNCVFSNNTVTASGGIGGGVYVNRKIELENCVFSDNKCTGGGNGGHVLFGPNSILKGCEFTGTCQGGNGTCLRVESGSWSITNCVFRNMTCSGSSSRFIDLHGAGSTIVDCVFTNNANVTTLFYQNCQNLLFRQCLIADNASDKAVVPNVVGSTVFENCTIPHAIVTPATMSTATTNTFINCILPNATITSAGSYCNILSNCLVKVAQGGPYDSGVITSNPKFKDAENGDYTLEANSPCRERGLTLGWMTNGSADLLGNPRVVDTYGNAFAVGALPDLGCYEIQERKPNGLTLIFR
jgi:hypothetical protein